MSARTPKRKDANSHAKEATVTGPFVVDSLRIRAWEPEASASFDATLDLIRLAMAKYSHLISVQKHSANPDPSAIKEYREALAQASLDKRSLRFSKPADFQAVHKRYVKTLEQLRVATV